MAEPITLDVENLNSLLESGDKPQLRLLLNEQHPADLADFLLDLEVQPRLQCFRLLDLDNASAVLAELDTDNQKSLLKDLGEIGVVPLISRMSPDDAADLLGELPKERANSIINQMTDLDDVADLYELMSFKDDSAGGIMSTDYLALHSRMTVEEALAELREAYEDIEEEIYDLLVVDEEEHLVGWLSVKELLTAPTDALIESLMDTNVITVTTDTDQEEAAETLSRYDLLSLPVIDTEGKLRGIITADDAMDVMEEEATEDIYQSSGIDTTSADASENISSSVRQAFRARLPWLIVTLGIEAGAAMVITHFDSVIQETVIAAAFMPLLNSVTGSVAMQSTCIIIRGMKKQLNMRYAMKNIFHEARVGMLLGAACALITTLVAMVLRLPNYLGIVVGTSLFLTMSVGVLIGTLIPMMFEKMGIEPAHASGPLITSILDVCTMTIYLSIVHAVLVSLAH